MKISGRSPPAGLAFVFDSMEIGPAGAGAGHIIVPFAELRQIIRSDGPLATLMR
jgi:hypothetical protein